VPEIEILLVYGMWDEVNYTRKGVIEVSSTKYRLLERTK